MEQWWMMSEKYLYIKEEGAQVMLENQDFMKKYHFE